MSTESGLEYELQQLDGDLVPVLQYIILPAFLLDTEAIVRWQNGASVAVRGERVGTHVAELVSAGDQAVARDAIAGVLAGGGAVEIEVNLVNGEGEYESTEVELNAVSVRGGGAIVAIFGLSHHVDPEPAAAIGYPDPQVSKRQLEILRLLAAGRSTTEIAAQLDLTKITVRNHIANLLDALGVHSRLQAVVKAQQSGLLKP